MTFVTAASGTGSGTGLVAALTFDDGPNGRDTLDLLDFLAEHSLPAVFAVIGENIEAPDGAKVLRRIVDDGHVLCNHSTGFADMGGQSFDEAVADMRRNLEIIRAAVGDVPVPYFRAPNGSWGEHLADAAVALGMRPLGVINTIGDWMTQDVPTLVTALRAAFVPGQLVLAHDGGGDRAGTVEAVRTVVLEKLAEGWAFSLPE